MWLLILVSKRGHWCFHLSRVSPASHKVFIWLELINIATCSGYCHDDDVTWKHFLHYWLFVRLIHWWPVVFLLQRTKDQGWFAVWLKSDLSPKLNMNKDLRLKDLSLSRNTALYPSYVELWFVLLSAWIGYWITICLMVNYGISNTIVLEIP